MASIVEEIAGHSPSFIEIPWEEERVLEALIDPSKTSLLHWFIFRSILVYRDREYRKNNDLIEEEDIRDLEAAFSNYGIELQPFDLFCSQNKFEDDEELGEIFYQWYESEFDSFGQLWEQLTAEVFHLLFANRNFLLKFNLSLAEYLEEGEVTIPQHYLNQKGQLKRCTHLPTWLKKAVYFRDQGRCVLCQKDLSGLLSTDRRLHYDHIVPLHLWGTNDPSNFQLCETCNLEKSKKPGITSNKYPPWWE